MVSPILHQRIEAQHGGVRCNDGLDGQLIDGGHIVKLFAPEGVVFKALRIEFEKLPPKAKYDAKGRAIV
jgi:hypothetical protein